MLRPLRQDERVTTPSVRSNDIGTDLRGSVVVVNDPAKGLLNTEVQAIAFSVVGLVHDEIELERFSPRVLFRRVVSRWAAVHRDHPLESVPTITGSQSDRATVALESVEHIART